MSRGQYVAGSSVNGLVLCNPPQCIPPPQASMDATAANPSVQTPSSNGSAGQRPSARKKHPGQPTASCTVCRRRKVRCDRGVPCGNCKRAGEDCVPTIPSHAPREDKEEEKEGQMGNFWSALQSWRVYSGRSKGILMKTK